MTHLDFALVKPDTAELERHLAAERNLQPGGVMVILDYPVQVLPDGIIEVRWTGGITPSGAKAIKLLGRYLNVAQTEYRHTDLSYKRGMDKEEARARITALVQRGDDIAAADLARRAYGYSETEAMNFIDGLRSPS